MTWKIKEKLYNAGCRGIEVKTTNQAVYGFMQWKQYMGLWGFKQQDQFPCRVVMLAWKEQQFYIVPDVCN